MILRVVIALAAVASAVLAWRRVARHTNTQVHRINRHVAGYPS